MTKEQIYKGILEYVNTLDENDQKVINRAANAEQTFDSGMGVFILADILIGLKADIRADCAKANGNTNALKSALEIIKAAKKEEGRPGTHGAWIVNDKQYVCDGYRALRFNKPLDLPAIPDKEQPINAKQLFDDCERNDLVYPVPNIGDLKAFIKLEYAKQTGKKRTVLYDAGEVYPLVNAEFLLNMITALDDCKIYYTAYLHAPMFCKGTNGEGLLLPFARYQGRNDYITKNRLSYERDGKFHVRGENYAATFNTWAEAEQDFERINAEWMNREAAREEKAN